MICDRSVVFSVSSTNKTGLHDINEILLKVALNTIKQTNKQTLKRYIQYLLSTFFCAKDTSFPLQGNITAATNTNKSKTFIFFIFRFRMSLSTQSRRIYSIEFTSVPRIHSQKQVKPTNMSDCFDTKTTTFRYNGALKGYNTISYL